MSLDIHLNAIRKTEVYWANITHNLGKMASKVKCGKYSLYEYLWKPDEIKIKTAKQLIKPLTEGLAELKSKPKKYEKYNSPNSWGMYENFVPFVEKYLEACKENPDAEVYASR